MGHWVDDHGKSRRYLTDARFQSLIHKAPGDPEAAWKILAVAADMMRKGRPLSDDIADFIASAIETAMPKPLDNRLTMLSRELHLNTENRRPAPYHPWQVYEFAQGLKDEYPSQRQLFTAVGEALGIGRSTVERLYKKAAQDLEE